MEISEISAEESDFTLDYCQFLDDFRKSGNKRAMVEHPPKEGHSEERLAFLAAVVETLAEESEIAVPMWAVGVGAIERPVYAFDTDNPRFREYLENESLPHFAKRGIYLGPNVMKRA